MRKDGLVDAVMRKAGIEKRKQATEAVDAVFETIKKTMSRGEEVGIAGFGSFKVVRRKARMGINPKTQEKIQIPAANRPKFQAGKALKEAVN